jgi:hypothetical protein
MAAGLVEPSLPDILAARVPPIKLDCIRLLDFDDAKAAHAFDAQHMTWNFREALPDRLCRFCGVAGIDQHGIP